MPKSAATIMSEEFTQEERLRLFKEAADEATNVLELSEAWWTYADNLVGWYRQRAHESYTDNLKRVGVTATL